MPRLDDALGESLPGQSMLISNEPGVTPLPFVMQAVSVALGQGRSVVYLAIDRAPGRVLANLAGLDHGKLLVIDGYSALHGIPEPGYEPVDVGNVAEVIMRMEEAHQSHPDAVFIMDSLNGLTTRSDPAKLAASSQRLKKALQAFPDSIVSYTQWQDEPQLRPLLATFAHHMRLSAVQDRIITHHYFRLEKIAGHVADMSPVLYRDDDGGVRVYIPKIVVTGPGDAGKSTFIHAVSDRAISADRLGKTVALDKGMIERNGLRIDLFGTPGQERFDPMMGPILNGAVGLVLVVDSTDTASFPRARAMLERAWKQGMHTVIAANKQDLEGAVSPDELVQAIDPPGTPDVIACQATEKASADDVLELLLSRILETKVVTA